MTLPSFTALGLSQRIETLLARNGIAVPTPVQMQAIPLLLRGADLIASAPTGTGKTAAFMLPALERLANTPGSGRGPRMLVLTPTRELAQQVARAAVQFAHGLPRMKVVCITGGESYREQQRHLGSPYEILVATPGRLMDQMARGRIDYGRLGILVLDEADRMLDMGFSEDVMAIVRALPRERQTVCFTATLSAGVHALSKQLQRSPQIIEVSQQRGNQLAIDQHVIYVDDVNHKRRLLDHWLADVSLHQAVIFTATKREAERLARDLDTDGHAVVALHGDLEQRQRTRMLNRLRQGEARMLVATDVAARGIDVLGITHVFNFDLPRFAEDYVHRIGRTGRAGANGMAISFVARQEIAILRRIERFLGQSVKVTTVTGLEARFRPSDPLSRGTKSFRAGKKPSGNAWVKNRGGNSAQRRRDPERLVGLPAAGQVASVSPKGRGQAKTGRVNARTLSHKDYGADAV